MREARYIEIPGTGTHELPPLLVHAEAEHAPGEDACELASALEEAEDMLSVRMPASAYHSASSRPSGAPPEMKVSTRPPMPARIFENTSLFASFQLREVGVFPARISGLWVRPTERAQSKMARLGRPLAFCSACA